MDKVRHIPVMLDEVLAAVAPRAGDLVIDGTFGAGGYSRALLDAADCRVLALDRDPTAIAAAAPMIERYGGRLRVVEAQFSTMADVLAREDGAEARADAVVLDIGVSSMQIDTPERGFSFQADGPLDMRMSGTGPTAADFLNGAEADEIADVLFHLGEERQARRIARAIVHDRVATPFTSTRQLASLVQRVLKAPKIDGRHAATRTFQALRIFVNDELGELGRALTAAERILKPGGRLAVVTFHSLEDGIVKAFFRGRGGKGAQGSRHLPMIADTGPAPSFSVAKQVSPSAPEMQRNPRARSARLRSGTRTEAPAWPLDLEALGITTIGPLGGR